jgi:hypothetical protein
MTATVETAELAIFENAGTDTLARDIEALKHGAVNVFASMPSESFEEKVSMLDYLTNSKPIDPDALGKPLELVHYIVQPVEMTDEQTGELRNVPRVILIDANGESFHAISGGIFSALKNISGIAGMPATWEKPVTVTPTREKTRNGFNVFTLKVGKPSKK